MRFLLIGVAAMALSACGDIEDTKEYRAGYEAGRFDGYKIGFTRGKEEGEEEGKAAICDEIQYRLNDGAADAVGC